MSLPEAAPAQADRHISVAAQTALAALLVPIAAPSAFRAGRGEAPVRIRGFYVALESPQIGDTADGHGVAIDDNAIAVLGAGSQLTDKPDRDARLASVQRCLRQLRPVDADEGLLDTLAPRL